MVLFYVAENFSMELVEMIMRCTIFMKPVRIYSYLKLGCNKPNTYEFLCVLLGYPLAVKLGTITKDGKADVFSYDEDDMVEDPNLGQHLAHFGINPANLVKVWTL